MESSSQVRELSPPTPSIWKLDTVLLWSNYIYDCWGFSTLILASMLVSHRGATQVIRRCYAGDTQVLCRCYTALVCTYYVFALVTPLYHQHNTRAYETRPPAIEKGRLFKAVGLRYIFRRNKAITLSICRHRRKLLDQFGEAGEYDCWSESGRGFRRWKIVQRHVTGGSIAVMSPVSICIYIRSRSWLADKPFNVSREGLSLSQQTSSIS